MRTTVELPPELLRAAKTRAAERGETLKDLFARALSRELGQRGVPRAGDRVELPLVGHGAGQPSRLTNADIEAMFAAEDAERYGTP